MDSPSGTPGLDSVTQGCRDFVRTCTYEDIVACTIYAAPMLFMVGPASILAMEPLPAIILQTLMGVIFSWALHRVGHGLLIALPKGPQQVYISSSHSLPMTLTRTHFLWGMELLVGGAMFCAILGKRFLQRSDEVGLLQGLSLIMIAMALYFLPVYLGRLWIRNYYPAMTLVGPTEEIITRSLPGFRFLPSFARAHRDRITKKS